MSRRHIIWIITCWGLAGLLLAVMVMMRPGRPGHAPYQTGTRTYYLAAINEPWDFAPQREDLVTGRPLTLYADYLVAGKRRFHAYADATFTAAKPDDPTLGILGPTIRGVPGDTIKIVFKNNTDQPANLRAPELPGAQTSGDEAVAPGQTATYSWKLPAAAGPAPGHGSSRVWPYVSTAGDRDQNAGLIGAVIVTGQAYAQPDATPDDVDEEFVAWLKVFDESSPETLPEERESTQMHSINGLIYSNQTGYIAYKGDRTRWHLLADPAEADIDMADWSLSQPPSEIDRRSVQLADAKLDLRTIDFTVRQTGQRIFHTIHPDHRELGMATIYYAHEVPGPVLVWMALHAGPLAVVYRDFVYGPWAGRALGAVGVVLVAGVAWLVYRRYRRSRPQA